MGTQLPPVGYTRDGSPADAPSLLARAAFGGALVALGMRRRGVFGTVAGIAGAGVLASVLAPAFAPRLSGVVAPRRAIGVEDELIVRRPRPEVFAFFRNFENFPLLGGILHSVEDHDDGRSVWRVRGPGGTLIEWDVIVTKYVPPRVIAWESLPDAPVESSGSARFQALEDGTTQLHVAVHYRPVTDAAARAFGPLLARRPERRVRAAIGRVEAAMRRVDDPRTHHREPLFPLPERTDLSSTATPPALGDVPTA